MSKAAVYDVVEGMKDHLHELAPRGRSSSRVRRVHDRLELSRSLISAFAAAGFHPYHLARITRHQECTGCEPEGRTGAELGVLAFPPGRMYVFARSTNPSSYRASAGNFTLRLSQGCDAAPILLGCAASGSTPTDVFVMTAACFALLLLGYGLGAGGSVLAVGRRPHRGCGGGQRRQVRLVQTPALGHLRCRLRDRPAGDLFRARQGAAGACRPGAPARSCVVCSRQPAEVAMVDPRPRRGNRARHRSRADVSHLGGVPQQPPRRRDVRSAADSRYRTRDERTPVNSRPSACCDRLFARVPAGATVDRRRLRGGQRAVRSRRLHGFSRADIAQRCLRWMRCHPMGVRVASPRTQCCSRSGPCTQLDSQRGSWSGHQFDRGSSGASVCLH